MANYNASNFQELQQALTSTKNNSQADTINITNNITLSDFLPIIEEDVSLTINGGNFTVDGANSYRPFFVKSGTVVFDDLTFANGKAQGENGGGAGMAGALFIYDGSVTLNNATFSNNQAIGGNASHSGGGGMGLGFINPSPGEFGGNGSYGQDGGFGGGGGYGGGEGGFGGGGGHYGYYGDYSGGDGGFG